MKDLRKFNPGRKMREFWTFDDDSYQVMQCQGFDCGNSSDIWWLPEAGYSVSESALFSTEKAATEAALKQAQKEFEDLRWIISKLKAKL